MANKEAPKSRCEDCEFYDYDEYYDQMYCKQELDEDEMEHFVRGQTSSCPYFKPYDEYMSVRKQN
ncbi:MAG: hypothetical protein IKQ18_01395 [Clostridia bacterium]|jgi:hypothetical protein|nr:hypothetical protein [Clostridia bacterium]